MGSSSLVMTKASADDDDNESATPETSLAIVVDDDDEDLNEDLLNVNDEDLDGDLLDLEETTPKPLPTPTPTPVGNNIIASCNGVPRFGIQRRTILFSAFNIASTQGLGAPYLVANAKGLLAM
mmetsp:Transcript_13607/g.20657  ORF Transcript_13607/g.20657 Transcript_13607/m.20657 type:complete len:123 (-) Transcript_13607:752-1120(-)